MKLFIFLFTATLTTVSMAEAVNKWVDDNGTVHYGDRSAAESIKNSESLKIRDTYDQQSYDEGVERHEETKEIGDKLEKERIIEEEKRKEAEKKEYHHPPPSNRTLVINPPYISRPHRSGNKKHPVQLPSRGR